MKIKALALVLIAFLASISMASAGTTISGIGKSMPAFPTKSITYTIEPPKPPTITTPIKTTPRTGTNIVTVHKPTIIKPIPIPTTIPIEPIKPLPPITITITHSSTTTTITISPKPPMPTITIPPRPIDPILYQIKSEKLVKRE